MAPTSAPPRAHQAGVRRETHAHPALEPARMSSHHQNMKMKRSKRSGKLLHTTRDVSTRRPMHITKHTRDHVPSLRRPEVLRYFRQLVAEARDRGVHTAAWVIQDEHLHWFVQPASRDALGDATRYVFGKLARFVNRLFGQRGPVFGERYFSECCRTARHAFQVLGYVLKNAIARGHRALDGGIDRYTHFCEATIAADRFLCAVVGPTPRVRRALLVRMTRGPVPWAPLAERVQPRLPGL